MIVLSEHEVRELLDMESCIEAMTEVLASLARGELQNPLRSVMRPPGADTLLGLMPAYRGGASPAYALKEIVIVPDEPFAGPRHAHGWSPAPRRRDGRSCRDHERVTDHGDPHGRGLGRRDASARSTRKPSASRSSGPARRRAVTSTRCARSSTTRRSASGRAGSRRPRSSRARSAQPSRRRSTLRSSAPRSSARRPPRPSRSSRSAGSRAAHT